MVRKPVTWAVRRWFDLEVTGREHPPSTGPLIVAANHLSLIDPPMVSVAVLRPVRYLALDELFEQSRIFAAMASFFGSIRLPRGRPPILAMRRALEHLEGGGCLGVFPEGRRVQAWGEDPPERGAAWLALRSGAPIVPVAIAGSERTLSLSYPGVRRTAVRVWLEAPLRPEAFVDRVDPLASMMEAWRTALDVRLAHRLE